MLHIVSDESLEEAALFITARCNNINYTNKLVMKYRFFFIEVSYFMLKHSIVMLLGRKRITYCMQKRTVTSRSTLTRVPCKPKPTNIATRWCYIKYG